MISEKIVEKGLELLDTAASLAKDEGPRVLQEYLNLLMFQASIGIFRNILYGIFGFMVVRLLNAKLSSAEADLCDGSNSLPEAKAILQSNVNVIKAIRALVTVGTTTAILVTSLPSLERMGKIIIAPRVFMIQEGAAMLKSMKGEAK
jgi:hypothetical protein